MSHFQQNQEFFDKPIRLSEEERKDPMKVIEEFFTDYRLSEIREINQQTDHVCLGSDVPPFDQSNERDCLIAYREREEKVMEAAFVLFRNKDTVPATAGRSYFAVEANGQTSEVLDFADVQNKVFQLQNELSDLSKSLVKSFGKAVTLRFHSK